MVKNSPAKAGEIRDVGLIPGLGRSPGGGHGNPLQCPCLENPMDRGAWRATVHRVVKSQTEMTYLAHTEDLHVLQAAQSLNSIFAQVLFLRTCSQLCQGQLSQESAVSSRRLRWLRLNRTTDHPTGHA